MFKVYFFAWRFRQLTATLHLLTSGYDIRTIQELLGHGSVETTMIYTYVLNSGARGVRSPFDQLGAATVSLSRPG